MSFGGFSFSASKPAFGTPQSAPATSFGQPQQSAPASSGGLFGGGFGGVGQTPGANSSPAFGASTGFGFGGATSSPSLFGGASSGSSLFGASSAPSLFGASSAPSLFGGASSAPSLFGPSSAPSLFGGASSGSSLFGASSTPSLFGGASSGSSLFGGSTAPSLFSTPTSAPAFGSTFAPPSTSQPAWGAPPQQQQQQQQLSVFGAAPGLPQPPTDAAVREIMELKAAYTPSSPSYKFKYLFLNVVDNPAQRVKPSGVDEMRWRQAMAAAGGPNNPDRLWPVLAVGFKDLLARSAAQTGALEENTQRLKSLNDIAHGLARKHDTELKQRSSDVQRRHIELSHRLLKSFRSLDALESRLAASVGYRGDVARAKEQAMSRKLGGAEAEVSPVSSTSLPRRLEGVAAAARTRAGGPGSAGGAQARLDDRSAAQLMVVLRDHAVGISKLQAVLAQDALDLKVMQAEGASSF